MSGQALERLVYVGLGSHGDGDVSDGTSSMHRQSTPGSDKSGDARRGSSTTPAPAVPPRAPPQGGRPPRAPAESTSDSKCGADHLRVEVHGGRDRLAKREPAPREQADRHVRQPLAGDQRSRGVEARHEHGADAARRAHEVRDQRRRRFAARSQRVLERGLHVEVDRDARGQALEQVARGASDPARRSPRSSARTRSGRPRLRGSCRATSTPVGGSARASTSTHGEPAPAAAVERRRACSRAARRRRPGRAPVPAQHGRIREHHASIMQ